MRTPVGNPAILHVSIPAGEDRTGISDPDRWLSECWLLNISGASGTFTVKIEDVSGRISSYDTHLVIALNDAAYNNLVSLTVDTVTIAKNEFKYGTLRPYNLWNWPSGDVYPTWFNDTLVNLGTIPPKGHVNVTVSATFSNATGARMHFDVYGSTKSSSIPATKKRYITHNPLSEDSTVLFWPPPLIPPVACFTVSNDHPNVCETVTFNATCSYDMDGWIVSYMWNFGDTNTTTVTYPIITHHYDTFGNYTATLTVTDNNGLTNGTSKLIWVRGHPVARFTYSPSYPQVCEVIVFNASDSTPDGGYIVNYTWNFGDSNTTTVTDPIITHHYDNYGNFTVTLNVTDSEGKWDTESKVIRVRAHPHADFTWSPTSPQVGELVTFNGCLSTPDGGTIVSYEWDFGDVSSHEFGKIVNHTYSTYGTYTVTLSVTDSEGKWDTESKNITVRAHPHADFSWSPPSPQVDEEVTFNASASTPDGGEIVSYKWDFGDGGKGDGEIVTHTYATFGNFIVTLNVTDSEGKWDTESKIITVTANPPNADFTWSPLSPQVCENVTFDASASTPDGGTIISYDWDFGDGEKGTGKIVIHHYLDWGNFTVTLNVTNSEGKWDAASKNITVREHPQADFTWSPLSPQVNEDVTFDASSSTPNGGTIVGYDWDFGDGYTSSGKIVVHKFLNWGNFTVTLNVTDSEGKWDTESKVIRVRAHPHADFTWSPTSPQVGETVTFDASASTPDGGTIVSYEWDFGDTSPHEFGRIVNHTYTTYGTYTVALTVTDSEEKWDVQTKTITVRAHPNADFTWSPLQPEEDQTVTFDASASTPDGGTIVSYTWNFGDGKSGSGKIVTHAYKTAGTYTVTLIVTDSESKWDTESKQITVEPTTPPPVGGYAAPIDIAIGKEASHLLASQIGLALTLLAAMVVTILLTKRRSKTLK